jgi:hypothetical protein
LIERFLRFEQNVPEIFTEEDIGRLFHPPDGHVADAEAAAI